MRAIGAACPKCRRSDRAEQEETSGSSALWFVCARCGTRYMGTLSRQDSVGAPHSGGPHDRRPLLPPSTGDD